MLELKVEKLGTDTDFRLPTNALKVADFCCGVFEALLAYDFGKNNPPTLTLLHTRLAQQVRIHARARVPSDVAEPGLSAYAEMFTHRRAKRLSVMATRQHFNDLHPG
jgi:hypothetical protein